MGPLTSAKPAHRAFQGRAQFSPHFPSLLTQCLTVYIEAGCQPLSPPWVLGLPLPSVIRRAEVAQVLPCFTCPASLSHLWLLSQASLGLHIPSSCPLDSASPLPCLPCLFLFQGLLPCPCLPWSVQSICTDGQCPPVDLFTPFSMQQPLCLSFPYSTPSCFCFLLSLVPSCIATTWLMLVPLLFLQEAPWDTPPHSSGIL